MFFKREDTVSLNSASLRAGVEPRSHHWLSEILNRSDTVPDEKHTMCIEPGQTFCMSPTTHAHEQGQSSILAPFKHF